MKVPTSKRAIRLGTETQKIAGEFLRREVESQLSGCLITVTEVRISDDLRHGAVYCSLHVTEELIETAKKKILRSASRLRKEIAASIRMKRVPEIRFVWDDTLNRADRIEQLLNHIHNSQSPPEEENGGAS